ncbi:MAG: hypothetical protein WCF12_08990 [Propionicimonas sp.]
MTSPWENPSANDGRPDQSTPAPGAQTPYTQPQVGQPYAQPQPSSDFPEPSDPWTQPGAPQSPYPTYPTTPAVTAYPVAPYPTGYAALPEHPKAQTSMVLGILGLVGFTPLSPFAWWIAAKAKREIAQFPGRYATTGSLTAGYIMGIIGTVMLGLALMIGLFLLLILIVAAAQY